MSGQRREPVPLRFYFDADTLGLGKVLAPLRADITYPGLSAGIVRNEERAVCPVVDPSALDRDWIPIVAQAGLTVITRDRRIASRPSELEAVKTHGLKLVVVTTKENLRLWGLLEIVVGNWRSIERVHEESGPFAYRLGRAGLRRIQLP